MSDRGRRFIEPDDVETMVFDWGTIKWFSEPKVTATARFTMGLVILEPGKGHERHNHPGVEETLFYISGEGEQMVEVNGKEVRQHIRPGMTCHIPADVYHETINTAWEPLRIIATYCPPGPEEFLRTIPGCRILPPGALPEQV